MTAPDQSNPDGSLGPGLFAERQAMTESDAKTQMKVPLGAWDSAQGNMKSEFISARLVNGEIVRLDNRIDEILIGTERAFLYTFSESGVWNKHPAAYKVVVDALSGATGGVHGSSTGLGGYSGGWERKTFTGTELEDLPASVAVTVGGGAPGGNATLPGASSFGSFVSSGPASANNYGTGSRTYRMRGGTGGRPGSEASLIGTKGSDGPFSVGGSGGGHNQAGGHGFSVTVGQIGTGSAGGGGGGAPLIFDAGRPGGHGGWPSAPGGGGGYGPSGSGQGGNGAGGAVFVTVYVSDELGVPPSTPTNLAVSNVTRNAARVTWDASIDDVMVKNYVLYLNGSRYGVVTATSHDFVGLEPSTTYEVKAQAVDIGDNVSALSNPLTFTTLTS